MTPFAGYDMPLWYPSGARDEHVSVLTNCGIFDTSHMAAVRVSGPGARGLLQWCFSRDLDARGGGRESGMTPGKCLYGVFLDESGGVVDDAIVYDLARDDYLAVVNAGMGPPVSRHLMNHRDGRNVEISDLTDVLGKIDIQGPLSGMVLKEILAEPERVLADMDYFTFKGTFENGAPGTGRVLLRDGTPVLLSRTGYTGEFGFELLCPRAKTPGIWDSLLSAGGGLPVKPCGMAARDSLRTGAMLPLARQDIGDWPFMNNPWTFALPYAPGTKEFTKDFLGREALEKCRECDHTYPFVGYDPRKVPTGGITPVVMDGEGNVIGTVLTCVTDTGIGRIDGRVYSITSPDRPEGFVPAGLSCGFVRVGRELAEGETIRLKKGAREIAVSVVKDIRPDRTARHPIERMITWNHADTGVRE